MTENVCHLQQEQPYQKSHHRWTTQQKVNQGGKKKGKKNMDSINNSSNGLPSKTAERIRSATKVGNTVSMGQITSANV